ncbi:hypothetical protein [Ruegeria arenilitoris]|uniref:hypothetical protein n=1 Tax=Ruegeria arenilitoris TaxID=1173585 RepID=UPI00147B507B|nr:hypothetical protein [Ruegeria arenilitoris]
MMDPEILDLLEEIGRTSTARLTPAICLAGKRPQDRRSQVLKAIRCTILPRRLDFVAADGTRLSIDVGSSRVTNILECDTGPKPDFEMDTRASLIEQLARLISDLVSAPGPLQLESLCPDTSLAADDVGLTYSEVATACANIDLPEEPRVTLVPDNPIETESVQDPNSDDLPAAAKTFYDGMDRFALGRFLISSDGIEVSQFEGLCAQDQPAHPDKDVLSEIIRDLVGWQTDSSTDLPQMVVMRPSGGQGTGVAFVSDGKNTTGALHDARKLEAVVSMWKSSKNAAE